MIRPVYTEQLPDGRIRFGLNDFDFGKVRAGYACANCLEDFTDSNGVIAAYEKCPVCKHTLDVASDVLPAPTYWLPQPTSYA